MAIPLIIDCDTGADDAIALLMAFSRPDAFNILGVCVVAGNAPLEYVQRNTRKICELAGRTDANVFAGCPRPMLRDPILATYVHGESGMDGCVLPEPVMPLQNKHAIEFLIETLSTASEKITLVITGPMTNLAIALIQRPEIADNIEQIIAMGGSIGAGNITPAAEFNMYADPHAAYVVFNSGIKITLIGLDVTHQIASTPQRIQALRDLKTPVGHAAAGIISHGVKNDMEKFALVGRAVHDACTIAYLLNPGLFEVRPAKIQVETSSALTLGNTVVSTYPAHTEGVKTFVALDVKEDETFDLIFECLKRYEAPQKVANGT